MNTTLAKLRQIVRANHDDWESGIASPALGPCWPIARVIADAGHGRVWFCQTSARNPRKWWGHFVVITPLGDILDCAGEYVTSDRKPLYRGWKLEDNVPLHRCYRPEHVLYWREKFVGVLFGK
jgi:hypothetical protein